MSNTLTKYPADVITDLHPLFKGLRWVAAARSKDEERYVLNLIKIEQLEREWQVVATDGRRIHLHTFDPGLFDTDIDMPQPGLYEVVVVQAKQVVISLSDESGYPDWQQIFQRVRPRYSRNLALIGLSKIGIDTGVLLASDFAAMAAGFGHGQKKTDLVRLEYGPGANGPEGPFYIRHELGEALVMPMRQGDDEEEDEVEATPEMGGFQKPSADPEGDLEF